VEHGAVTGPGELDLAPDAMYAEIRNNAQWMLFMPFHSGDRKAA
jgi:hypothetical protein